MHLLAAQPGGFVDEEGIIDLAQTPAKIVILSAADSSLTLLAQAQEAQPKLPSLRLANWMQLLKPAAFDLYQERVLDQTQLVIVSLLGGQSYWSYGIEQLHLWAQQRGHQLIVVPGDDSPDPALQQLSTCDEATYLRVWRYLRESGSENAQQLLYFLASTFFAQHHRWREPQVLPAALIHKPQQAIGSARLADWQQSWQPNRPVVLLLFYRSHLLSGNRALFDQLIDQLQQEGINPLPLAIRSLKEPQSLALINDLLERSNAQLILNSLSFASNRAAAPELSSTPTLCESPFVRDLPVLQLILASSSAADWQSQQQGLRSRDLAMQVVLPEMDGRVIGRAIAFKSENRYSEAAQISLIQHQLHPERARWLAQWSRAYLALRQKKNSEKRLALILANYPTQEGRIGNGVGLDTPASTLKILTALQQADFPVENIPVNGNTLIEALLSAISNDPATLAQRPCYQSLSLADYRHHFTQLPSENQQAVLARWGEPEKDPKCRNGRLMLAGIRLGETFVGIQPARGFNIDLLANYHDPDLVPPHAYLAFYFWLRHVYHVNAVIHVGKHGNLEWLPGKGNALSEQCWPDIALGPMPHFYPFIVNDPGEGAQAKRRAQAVIIDHLMPPMARAESYGELNALENLVDEYYQALGMDQARENWLREQILQQVKQTHLLEELTLPCKNNSTEQIFNQLDAYLCEIKEAQIRDGLHILGTLPETDSLAETLVALLRLPRGNEINECGLLHNLAHDLGLPSDFDPLQASAEPWHTAKPTLLQQQSSALWRTAADTRERLELLALSWVKRHLLEDHDATDLRQLSKTHPRTAQQLGYAKTVILAALKTGVKDEIQALINGLQGQAVPPGPSGAPTRGRLDVLPTGRNFFSLDNRSVPSQAAWALGQLSAQRLIERHLQEHGDYPKQVGLSVWGTATMRTGGDDIAQAFALMGIEPIWAVASQRVIDFRIIPAMQLGRPRVDVTLRVSGFFRDAFANVMKLFDAAVLALAELEEPGESNTIRQTILADAAELQATGQEPEQAWREASYRVYGSKPGAYGAGLQGLIDGRCWQEQSDLAEAYLNWGGYAYGNQAGDGVAAKNAFQQRLSQLQVVLHNQDNREHDLLDSDDYYQFQGGMTAAVNTFSGKTPQVYHSDHSNPSQPKIRTLQEELNRVIRSRVLNPKWIKAMRRHGYKGAFEMAATVDYLFAYDATTDLIADYQYEKVSEALVFDAENQRFLHDNNPKALEEMAERLLEATQRGLWQEPGEYAGRLQDLLLALDEGLEG
ncbi:MAG: cobaltochelatase subunit CobN [Gammaproteobacteria bacterium]|nr:cobaltochelatase subunit CobN [Gammaproteobacteria bacterium]